MKKILLVLSCCLATWCSVQAGLKSSPEISLMQASAPAAAPAPDYPAVINSASYNSSTRKVTVSFTVNHGSVVSFDLEATGKTKAEDVYTIKNVQRGTVSFSIPNDWQVANAVVIKVDGSACGGASVTPTPVPDPVGNKENGPKGYIKNATFCASTNSYDVDYISIKYNLMNTNNPNMRIKEGGKYGKDVWQQNIKNTGGAYENAIFKNYSSKLKENTTYAACLYDGNKNLEIYTENFVIPTQKKIKYYPEVYFDEGANTLVIRAPQGWPSYLKNISVMVYSNNGGGLTPQGSGIATNLGDYVRIQIPNASITRYYTIVVSAGGSYQCDRTMPIGK